MSSTNKTTNYELSQFIGTDKPAWLVDYNGDMAKIDVAIKGAVDDASNAQSTANSADGKADANALNISTLDGEINDPATGLSAAVGTLNTAVQGLNNTIGNTPLPTTAQTITGAIDELYSDFVSINDDLYAWEKVDSFTFTRTNESTLQEFLDAALNAHNAHLANDYGAGYASKQNRVAYDGEFLFVLDKLQAFPYTNHEWLGFSVGTWTSQGQTIKSIHHILGSFAGYEFTSIFADANNNYQVSLRCDRTLRGSNAFTNAPTTAGDLPDSSLFTSITFENDIYKKIVTT